MGRQTRRLYSVNTAITTDGDIVIEQYWEGKGTARIVIDPLLIDHLIEELESWRDIRRKEARRA